MANYKLIALDLDGTLLDAQKEISRRNRDAIAAARELGVYVILASGRPYAGMKKYMQQLNMTTDNDYVLCFNGARVERVTDGHVLNSKMLCGKDAKRVAHYARQMGLNTHAFSPERGLITPQASHYTRHEAESNAIEFSVIDFEQLHDDEPIIKSMVIDPPELLEKMASALPPELAQRYTVVRSAPFFLEFIHPQANKGAGVAALAQHLNISAEQVICCGDAGNDWHMLQYAGLGVAMGNATTELKTIADYITADHNDSGVAQVIETFILA
ncbi:HAD family hydrolase [Chelonobacter oris]|uniref:Cof-type HAD-IIB family hydrolase n=1 Tax=Chelonobacter oris TaxID=505317 RepID=UPI00244C005D|nr:Cof-type HAD-IIB family hydrolase [Chelonobacter oris]MDH2999770.1 HAD family hydrolase [Chelonobacter oris]